METLWMVVTAAFFFLLGAFATICVEVCRCKTCPLRKEILDLRLKLIARKPGEE